jgi:hypothetical protein
MAMNTRKLTLLFTALVGLAASAFAQSTATEATVARVTGTVTATLADGSTVAVTEGTKLPQGATITTGDKSEAYLVSHGDSTSVITANSVVEIAELSTTSAGGKVTEQKATLDLKSGNLVAKLNPAKKSVNQYSVRTPKGVAAARGTVFTVSYKGGNYTIAVVNGVVTINPPGALQNNTSVDSISVGAGSLFGESVTGERMSGSASAASSSNSAINVEIRELLAVAVATVTLAAQNNIGGTTAAQAAEVAAAVFAAVPAAAEQAGAIIAQSNAANPPADPARAATVMQEVTTATPAAAQGALTSGASTGTFTPNTQTTATNPGANTSQGTNQATTPQPIDPSTISRSN